MPLLRLRYRLGLFGNARRRSATLGTAQHRSGTLGNAQQRSAPLGSETKRPWAGRPGDHSGMAAGCVPSRNSAPLAVKLKGILPVGSLLFICAADALDRASKMAAKTSRRAAHCEILLQDTRDFMRVFWVLCCRIFCLLFRGLLRGLPIAVYCLRPSRCLRDRTRTRILCHRRTQRFFSAPKISKEG